jgi:hypothetical protein
MGNIVKVAGSLVLVDLSFLQKIAQVGVLRDALLRREIQQVLQQMDRGSLTPDQITERELLIISAQTDAFNQNAELLALLNNALYCHLLNKDFTFWATLVEENLVPSSSSVMLKHGVLVSGIWTMIGILDAVPGVNNITDEQLQSFLPIMGSVGTLTISIAQNVRNLFGKPDSSVGITPLLIYREVSR